MKDAEVAVIIPTYNRARQLGKAIDSVLQQTCPAQEIVVVDDCSPDNTAEVVDACASRSNRIHYVRLPCRSGAQKARNTGIAKSRSPWISFLDDDDTYLPDKLKRQIALVQSNSGIDVVSCYSKVIDHRTGNESLFAFNTKGNILNDLLTGKAYVDFNAPLIRREKLSRIGFLDEECPSYQEWDTFIRLAQICTFGYIPEPLCIYNIYKSDSSFASYGKQMEGLIYVLKKHRRLWLTECGRKQYKEQILKAFVLAGKIPGRYKRLKYVSRLAGLSLSLIPAILKRL